MGLINFNFNFGKNNQQIVENENIDFEYIKKKARIVVIDDEEFPHADKLVSAGYDLVHHADIQNVDDYLSNKFEVMILDIQGVGNSIAGDLQGWGVLKYLKKENPNLVIIVYTGADWSITEYKDVADLADFICSKDVEYLDFRMKLDAALRKSYSIDFHLSQLKNRLFDMGIDANRVDDLIRKKGGNRSKFNKSVRKIVSSDEALTYIDSTLSIVSSLVSIVG